MEYRHQYNEIMKHFGEGRLKDAGAIQKDLQLHNVNIVSYYTDILSGNSKQYLGKEYTEQQINEMDGNNINILSNRYESVLNAQMTKSLVKSVINLYSNVACSL